MKNNKKPSLWARLFNRPKVVNFVTDPKNKFNIVLITDSELVHETLGLTDERASHFGKRVSEEFKNCDSVTEVAERVSKECLHANELFWMTYIIAVEVQKRSNPLSALMRHFGSGQ